MRVGASITLCFSGVSQHAGVSRSAPGKPAWRSGPAIAGDLPRRSFGALSKLFRCRAINVMENLVRRLAYATMRRPMSWFSRPWLRAGAIERRSAGLRAAHARTFVLVLSLASCSAVVDADKAKLGPLPVPCEPGQMATCPCKDGSTSTQKCNAMARFDPCACGGATGRAATSETPSVGNAGSSGATSMEGRAASGDR